MNLDHITVPEIYTTSADFRFFLKWFKIALSKVQYDTENLADIYDPLKCPASLLWMLANTMGFKYDDRLPTSFNRLVLMYFMSMIRNRGSKDGMTIAAEVNLAQFNLLKYAKDKEEQEHDDILYDRLEDTSIPINAVYVTPHVEEGIIDVVYFSEEIPIDACIEYVRPVGMLLRQYAGVRFDGKTKISIDARLTYINENNDLGVVASTRVGHYTRKDYARLQQTKVSNGHHIENASATEGKRDKLYERNPDVESTPKADAGYRSLYSLQLCNNEHIVQSLLPIFGLGFYPQYDVELIYPDGYNLPDIVPTTNKYSSSQTYGNIYKGTCETKGTTVSKKITISDSSFTLQSGVVIGVTFTYTNTKENPTFNVNNTGDKSVYCDRESYEYGGKAEATLYYRYDGSKWRFFDIPGSKAYNLRYDKQKEEEFGQDVFTVENSDNLAPVPAVNPIMGTMGKVGDTMMTARDKDGVLHYVKYDSNGRPYLGDVIPE